MSGHLQRTIASAFDADPSRNFTTRELAAIAYPGVEIERRHTNAVIRAIPTITPAVTACRVGAKNRFGWHNVWGRS